MSNTDMTDTYFKELYTKISDKITKQNERLGHSIPYVPRNEVYEDMGKKDISWWTNGFWPGILWLMYKNGGNVAFKENAHAIEKRLDLALEEFEGLHHDVGFMWLLSAIANYRITGNERSRVRGLHAATILAGRYNPRGRFIRSWNEEKTGWIIVDSMMNLPILYWAAEQTEDERFSYIAMDHADSIIRNIVRLDGSCNHIACLNPQNGELLETPAGQGYATGSSWSRGQAWALYGFALSFRYTKEKRYLDTAKNVAHYFMANIAETGYVPKVDFRSPEEPCKIDTTAGVCAACGLLEIAEHTPEHEKGIYEKAAKQIIYQTSQRFCLWDLDKDAILNYGTAAYHQEKDTHVPIIYGDYFFIEAVLRILGRNTLLW